ncbi:MAG: MSMEG_0568 family radical SAM protein [Deltaproteobacteria bacterium]|nr:MSMEG_0568 family radical SAM protein [Deltaproteobacteria bacterium]
MELPEIITEVQSLGVKLPEGGVHRKGGAGPAEAGSLVISGIAVSVPASSPFVSRSPYVLKTVADDLFLFKGDENVVPVTLVPRPRFYDGKTAEGVPCSQIALLHGTDCLASSVLQTCIHWHPKTRCRFCGIELSLKNQQTIPVKSPGQLAETAVKARALDAVRHVVLTTGTGEPPGSELSLIKAASAAIKKVAALPIHAQFLPPAHGGDLSGRFQALKTAGVDTVGIHIETFDLNLLETVAPMKAALGLKRFEAAWEAAVAVFGPNQVSSFLIAGLGEAPESLVQGSEYLADRGVYPFVVPLRPIPGSLMADAQPPDPDTMKTIYDTVSRILAGKGLAAAQSLAGCVRCGACSALPAYERRRQALVCHPSRTPQELDAAFAIRETVFVQEQQLFETSDRDAHDQKSIHLVAKQGHEVIGTVRVFPAGDGNGHWIGGRLAVKKGLRSSGAGELLVKHAVSCVKDQGCTRFTAHIQAENVPFFEQLGWRGIEPVAPHFGRPHQLMAADLETGGIDS